MHLFTYTYLNRPSLVVAKADSTLHRYSLATGQPLSSTREPINTRLYILYVQEVVLNSCDLKLFCSVNE